MIAEVIAAEVCAELEGMLAASDGKVVDKLILSYVASLGEGRQRIKPAEVDASRGYDANRESLRSKRLALLELSNIVTAGSNERVARSG
jgi:hypothetical protein